jgi:hypothetical protein
LTLHLRSERHALSMPFEVQGQALTPTGWGQLNGDPPRML